MIKISKTSLLRIAATKKSENKKHKDIVDAGGTQTVGSEILYYGESDSSFRRQFSNDDDFFVFHEFCKHHKLGHHDAALKASLGHERLKPYFAWLKFGISNGLKRNSNSTQLML